MTLPARICLSTATALLALAFVPLPSNAATRTRVLWSGAAAVCNPLYPDLDPQVRRRAHEIRNNGPAVVTIACGTMTDAEVADGAFFRVTVYFQNHSNRAATITCTLQAGRASDTINIKKSLTAASGAVDDLAWTAADFGETRTNASILCDVPVGWSIRDLSVSYNEDIAA